MRPPLFSPEIDKAAKALIAHELRYEGLLAAPDKLTLWHQVHRDLVEALNAAIEASQSVQ